MKKNFFSSLALLAATYLSTGCDGSVTLTDTIADENQVSLAQNLSDSPVQQATTLTELDAAGTNYWHSRTSSDAQVSAKISALPDYGVTIDSYELLMSDQITLKAIVARPTGNGRFPIVVMPSSWSLNYLEYAIQARNLATRGYVAVSFTSRGFWDAGGLVEGADPRTVQDVSEIIDWTIAMQQGDAERIGAGGISYGAGIALLASARDSRIDAVFAMSGWTDLRESFYYNDTVSQQAEQTLGTLASLTGRIGPDIMQLLREASENNISDDTLNRVLPVRSPFYELPALNNNRPAVLQINSWNDALFPPGQLLKFYRQYRGQYRLVLTTGAHGTHEAAGLVGLPNESWSESINWLDIHLQNREDLRQTGKGLFYTNNTEKKIGIDDVANLPVTWSSYQLQPLSPSEGFFQPSTGSLSDQQPNQDWLVSIDGGVRTGATSGFIISPGLLQDWFQIAPRVNTNSMARKGAAIWRSEPYQQPSIIVGSPRVNLSLVPTRVDSTIFVYLYDEGPLGWSRLITHAPYSKRGLAVGEPLDTEISMQAMTYELEAGHRLVLAIDTEDSRYISMTDNGETIGLQSTPALPASLHIPILDR